MDARLFPVTHHHFKTGFLPEEMPLTCLPEISELNCRINDIAFKLPTILRANQLCKMVDDLEKEFTHQRVMFDRQDKRQQNVALLFLTMITQVYIWEGQFNSVKQVPAILGNSLNELCQLQNRYPTLTYADYALHNFKKKNPNGEITLDNIDVILTFTGSADEAWFVKIHVAIEAMCSEAISAAYQACTQNLNEIQLDKLLKTISSTLQKTIPILKQMRHGLDPNYFYDVIRPLYTGWNQIKNAENSGVKLSGFNLFGDNLSFSYRGASGAQSSILPLLDAALGIEHDCNAMSATLREFQNYMPNEHRRLIAQLKENNIKKKIAVSQNLQLAKEWENAVKSLALFRGTHISYFKQFVVQPSGLQTKEIKGTGSASPMEYLGDRYATTRAAKL